jgi:hypothetical protein
VAIALQTRPGGTPEPGEGGGPERFERIVGRHEGTDVQSNRCAYTPGVGGLRVKS